MFGGYLCYSYCMSRTATMEKIQEVSRGIAEKFQPEKIILFGSWAWGTPGPDSDVDFFVVKETDDSRKTAREIDGSIFPRPFPIDIIVYKPGLAESRMQRGDFFIKDIFLKGRVLYAR